jgi:methylenetetrahydrofolate dehydrogenase (NADP+)/methenyltetrahydrofolate cyclohydrolase
MSIYFDGKKYLKEHLTLLKDEVEKLKEKAIIPSLASVYLPDDPGSVLYTKLKKNAAESIGVKFNSYELKKRKPKVVISLIKELNKNKKVQGVIIQKPYGEKDYNPTDWVKIVKELSPKKDVDGLTPENLGLLSLGAPNFIPATVKAVMKVIEEWKVSLPGKNVVIIGTSDILGRPLSMLLTDKQATVSLLHKKTQDINLFTRSADILISATGKEGLIGKDNIKDSAVVIDVGAPKGDVRKDEIEKKAAYLSPVPGGVGPVTIYCLLENLVQAANSMIAKR